MTSRDFTTSINLKVGGNFVKRLSDNERAFKRFTDTGQRQIGLLRRSTMSLANGLEQLGGRYTAMLTGAAATYAGTRAVMESAKLDKTLIQLQQTAGATAEMTKKLRKELFELAKQSGQSYDSLLAGTSALIAAGMEWDEAIVSISAINPVMAVANVSAEELGMALAVAANAFDFDMTKQETVIEMLDQMTQAGRDGFAELEHLPGIISRIGVNAKAAGMEFPQMLAFVEQLSKMEPNPERLGTLADSTLRLFTNQRYLQNAADISGVNFYDGQGQRRDPFDILDDIAIKMERLTTVQQKDRAIAAMFGETDQDTQRGLRKLLVRDQIANARLLETKLQDSAGTIDKDFHDAINNAVDQVGRLKSTLREAADGFAEPINDAISRAITYLLDEKKLDGKDMLVGGTVAAIGGIAALKGGGKLLKHLSGVGVGVAAGKALEEATGVMPVYVVNMPGGGFNPDGTIPGGNKRGPKVKTPGRWSLLKSAPNMKTIGMMGAGAMGTAGLAVAGAGAAGYGVGTGIYKAIEDTSFADSLGRSIAKALAMFGNDNAQAALAAERRGQEMRGSLNIEVTDKRVQVKSMDTSSNLDLSVDTGMVMQ